MLYFKRLLVALFLQTAFASTNHNNLKSDTNISTMSTDGLGKSEPKPTGIKMRKLAFPFTACKLPVTTENATVSGKFLNHDYVFLARTPHEISIIAPTHGCEQYLTHIKEKEEETGWRCFEVLGPMPFNLVGIASTITGILAGKGISLLAQSTYDTDYFLVKQDKFSEAATALSEAGVEILHE